MSEEELKQEIHKILKTPFSIGKKEYDIMEAFKKFLESQKKEGFVSLKKQIKSLSQDDRLELLSDYCHYCGRTAPCQCWNDD